MVAFSLIFHRVACGGQDNDPQRRSLKEDGTEVLRQLT